MAGINVHFSSITDNWKTPKILYEALNKEFDFNYDPCPIGGEGGLEKEYGSRTFVNPPYSQLKAWCKKCYEESLKGKLVVMLIPSRTDTIAFHTYILPFNINLPRLPESKWAAGLIDGEGCIHIRKNIPTNTSKHKSTLYSLVVKVTMTHKETVYKLKDIFNCGHITFTKGFGEWKDRYSWTAMSDEAQRVLTQIYPFSITKRKEIFKALEFMTLDKGRGGRKRVEQSLTNERDKFYTILRELKKDDTNINSIYTEIRFIKGR